MYFKKLEIIGFKSFMEKTTLHFEPGVTAVVGPNGCGKSNIFDSIRWVLGEQSIKALRGSCMEDVIFNGTDKKESLGMAEVNLTFANEKRFFPVDHEEVVITRRIFRSGESEYLLNKAPARLKDISDLLMGTGIGAESYSLVEQGKIDLILSSKPEDRRMVFDEAAGITKYKAQKKEALKKLDETEQNLLRVSDIIAEVKRQIGSLERQANKARRYKEVFEELKLKEVGLALAEKNRLVEQRGQISRDIEALGAQEAGFAKDIQEQELKISSSRQALKSLEEDISGIKNELLNLDGLMARNKQRVSLNHERIVELASARKYLEAQIGQAKNKIFADEEKLERVKEEYASLAQNIAEKTELLREKEEKLEAISLSVKVSLENISRAKKEILDLVTRLTHLKNDIGDLNSKQQIYLARKRRLEIEKAKVNEEKDITEKNLQSISEEVQLLEHTFEGFNLQISQLKNAHEQNQGVLAQIEQDLEVLERKKLALESQREFTQKLKTQYEGIDQSLNAVIYLDNLPQDKISGLVIKIKDSLNLGEEDKHFFGFAKMKLKGEAKPIDMDTERLEGKISQLLTNIEELKGARSLKEALIQELKRDIQALEEKLRSQEIALTNKKTFRQGVLDQLEKTKEEEGLIAVELVDIQNELGLLEEELSRLHSQASDLEKEEKDKEGSILKEQNSITLNTDLKEKVLVANAQIKTELGALEKRIGSDEAAVKMLEDTWRYDKEALLHFEEQLNENQLKDKTLISEINALEEENKAAEQALAECKNSLLEKEERYKSESEGISSIVENIELQRKELDTLKNKLYELQMQDKDLEFKYLGIKERMSQAYKINLDEAVRQTQEALQEINAELLEGEIRKLKEKLDSLGTVNLVAIEEYDELKKRYDFLSQQQNDLFTAKESLHEAILKINRTTRKMFLETFQKIQAEFRNYFKLLFNGGDAQVFLIDEQEPLESGIEIICRPPGKKLQNVLLLSGGEKSLSAIALIFAVFKVKPSPFCILDEIDAALDEANVDRFGRILQEFTQNSQFIIITHNKKTIANANVMYGITMEESGVSKIVSVKFSQNKAAVDNKDKDKELVAEAV